MVPQFEIGATGAGLFWLVVLAWAWSQRVPRPRGRGRRHRGYRR